MKLQFISLLLILLLTACGGESSEENGSKSNKTTQIKFSDGSSIDIFSNPSTSSNDLKTVNYETTPLTIASGTKVTGFTQDKDAAHKFKLTYANVSMKNEAILLKSSKGSDLRISSSVNGKLNYLKTVKSGTLLDHQVVLSINPKTKILETPTHSDFTIINPAEVGEYTLSFIKLNHGSLNFTASQHLLSFSTNSSSTSCVPKVSFSSDTTSEEVKTPFLHPSPQYIRNELSQFHVFDFDALTAAPFNNSETNSSKTLELVTANAESVTLKVNRQENLSRTADPSTDLPPQDFKKSYKSTYACSWDKSGLIDSKPVTQTLKCTETTDYIGIEKLYTRDRSGSVTQYIPAGTATHTCTTAESERNRSFFFAF